MSMLPADVHRRLDVIDTGDTVRHGPTGEEWLVAHVEGDRLAWCGWPPGLASLSDCTLMKKATAADRDKLLHELADIKGDDFRARRARYRLANGV